MSTAIPPSALPMPRTSATSRASLGRPRRTHIPSSRAANGWNLRYLPLTVHAPLVIVVAMALWLTGDPVITLTVGGILSFPTYLLLAWIEARRAPLWLSPLSFYFVWYSVCFGPCAIHMANRISDGDIIGFSVTYVHPENLAPAYVIYLLGSFALHAGIQVLRPLPVGHTKAENARTAARRSPDQPENVPASAVNTAEPSRLSGSIFGYALLWLAGIAARLLGSALSFLGAAVGVLNWAPLAGLCAYSIVRGADKNRGVKFWVLLAIGILIELAFSLRTGSKAYIMFSFIPAVWLMTRERDLRRLLLPASLSLLFFYVAIVAPVVSTSRRTPTTFGESHAERIISTYLDDSYRDSADIDEQIDIFLDRQFDPIPVGFLHREVERAGLRYGDTMNYLLYAFIPRAIWADKPSVTRGGWFTLYLGQARKERDVSTSTGQSAIGELYWNFGSPGVLCGMGILGGLIGGLWRMASARPHEDALLFLLYISLCFGMLDMPEAGTVLVSLVYRALVIGFLLWIIRYIARLMPKGI